MKLDALSAAVFGGSVVLHGVVFSRPVELLAGVFLVYTAIQYGYKYEKQVGEG